MSTRQLSMAEAINEAICQEMERDENIVLLGQDIGPYGGAFGVYKGICDKFGPDRVRDGPLSEAATTGMGLGLAISGMPCIVEIEFIDFITLASDALCNQAAKMRYFFGGQVEVPLIVRCPIVNRLSLGAQHSQSLEAWLMHVPGLRVIIPSNATDAKGLLIAAVRDGNPCVFIENVMLYAAKAEVDEAAEPIPLGKLRVAREGSDVTIASYSGMVKPCLDAAEKLAADGINCEVLDLRTAAPEEGRSAAPSQKPGGPDRRSLRGRHPPAGRLDSGDAARHGLGLRGPSVVVPQHGKDPPGADAPNTLESRARSAGLEPAACAMRRGALCSPCAKARPV